MLIAQISDVHVGGVRYKQELLHAAIREINEAGPDIVVVAGDLTDDGYPDQYPQAKLELEALACDNVVLVPGNHDARNVGYVLFEDTSARAIRGCRLESAGLQVQLVGVDTRNRTWTKARSGASTTGGSRRASPATRTCGSSCAITT